MKGNWKERAGRHAGVIAEPSARYARRLARAPGDPAPFLSDDYGLVITNIVSWLVITNIVSWLARPQSDHPAAPKPLPAYFSDPISARSASVHGTTP